MFALRRWWREERWLLIGLLVLLVVYGLLAVQGALPLLSPDETAVFVLAKSFWQEGRLAVQDIRAETFVWLHPRSFTTQDGWLLPVGFPLWPMMLTLVGWIGSGAVILWLQVLVCASALIPLARLAERCWKWTKAEALLWASSILLFPVAILYGARSGFTLMPQLAMLAWSCWWIVRGVESRAAALLLGVLVALTVGLRPTEVVWIAPLLVVSWYTARDRWTEKTVRLIAGVGLGALLVVCLHWWVYGAPWLIGYLLPASSSAVLSPPSVPVSVSTWQRFFPYGFSLSRLRENGVAALRLGFWPWALVWVGGAIAWMAKRRFHLHRQAARFFLALLWTTLWLAFYYGQGRYADHIGGQAMHLGNSFLRYIAPALVGWMAWTGWVLLTDARTRIGRMAVCIVLLASIGAGVAWSWNDAEDGLARGRRERVHYAAVREQMLTLSDHQAVWMSDRSDKMLFSERMSVSPVPPRADVRQWLQAGKGQVFLYARPPRQQDRDLWSQEGLELIERAHFERENIYEVRLRAGFAE